MKRLSVLRWNIFTAVKDFAERRGMRRVYRFAVNRRLGNMAVKDGGPAFPVKIKIGEFYETKYFENGNSCPERVEQFEYFDGMTLRDYFAGQALALFAGRSWDHISDDGRDIIKAWAVSAYSLADAMIKEREKEAK